MARKFMNPTTHVIHVKDGAPVASGGTFTAKGDEDWLALLLNGGEAVSVDPDKVEDDRDAAAASVKAQTDAAKGDNADVPASSSQEPR